RPRGGSGRPDGREHGDAPSDVALRRRHAAGGREPEPRSGDGEGRRDDVRTVGPGEGSRAAEHGAHARERVAAPAGARLHHAGRAVVLAARRHERSAQGNHRAGVGTAMTEFGSLLADTVTRLFTDLVTKELIESSEKGVWPEKLWRALEE